MRTLIACITLSGVVAPALFAVPARADTVVGGPELSGHGYIWDHSAGVSAPPHIQASSYVIADLETGRILAAKDPHGEYRPASTLKTLTAITLIPRLDPAKKMKPSPNAVNASGSAVGMDTKWTYTVRDLFHGLLMQSGNDTAIALCEANGGLQPSLDQMNAEAHRIQALDTVARTPNGLDDDPPLTLAQQHSSAYDLALIMKQGLKLPDFRKYVGATLYHWPAPPDKKEREKGEKTGGYEIGTHDHLLIGSRPYKGMIGGKNGWTSHALGSFVGAATRDGHTIIIALMHAQSDFWDDARSLLDWGFAERAKAGAVGTLVDPIPPPQPKRPPAPATTKKPLAVRVSPADGPDWAKLGAAGGGGLVLLAIVTGLGIGLRRRRRAALAAAAPSPAGGHNVRAFDPEGPPSGAASGTADGPGGASGLRHPGDVKVAGAPSSSGANGPSAQETAPNPVRRGRDDEDAGPDGDGTGRDGEGAVGTDRQAGDEEASS
ncbi:D-alanyl-D-alanine carboxypeptidase family protein [Actinoallomurus rhizosphaericola]|uniref:D-alanyl-D-alanine carboxypeptidase family protein n=1 Tax=Actinoallomurus rhizosphaericola TaxID=2952536 RepID=UPI002093EA4B|nr:D-alanyl-D-alanine carboxypeptidase [Actinoallomurus rhizosphaericola]MCO5999208.1 D-alanyl-D-alanine carboxypeptidase [Actinoallomurus rhizosphaericola]